MVMVTWAVTPSWGTTIGAVGSVMVKMGPGLALVTLLEPQPTITSRKIPRKRPIKKPSINLVRHARSTLVALFLLVKCFEDSSGGVASAVTHATHRTKTRTRAAARV